MKQINTLEDLDTFILDNKDNIILLYFGALWCDPCKKLKEFLTNENTINEMPKLAVCYIDVDIQEDRLKDIFGCYNINVLPTQIFITLNKEKIIELNRIEGFDKKLLQEYYSKNCYDFML
jgi:thiol-disulfide isomerase/thioredoxin